MEESKPKRGRPKLLWDAFADELERRLKSCEAEVTVEAEADYLAEWAKAKGICTPYGTYLSPERIRERIKKRKGGSKGYQNEREWHRSLLKQLKPSDLP